MTKRKYEADILIPPESVQVQSAEWQAQHSPMVLEPEKVELYVALIEALLEQRPLTGKKFQLTMREYARQGLPWMSKSDVISVYDQLCRDGVMENDPEIRIHLQKKPTRSQAGVTVVTVLTKPYPCPGKCIFCPTDVRMPKSYLHDEPGAQRAERHGFDPYAQTNGRLSALEQIGHPTDKIELLILGGTWSSYMRDYQEWFVKRCFDAMNGEDSETLEEAQRKNAAGVRRNVGLVVETRQDHIDEDELRWMRYLGVTKVQVGIQSLNEHILEINKRGHDVQSTRDAFKLLRLGGFKIHGHWMANLLGATVESDIEDYGRIWDDKSIRPDELKLYPCMLVENAELYDYYQRGEYRPYTEEEVLEVLVQTMPMTPRYVRLNRVIRDFPTNNVVEGNKKANLRQIAQREIKKRGLNLEDIRFREIRRDKVGWDDLELRIETYETDGTVEHFMSYETADNRLAGFLRLSFPDQSASHPLEELEKHAMIREVHVYGPVLNLGESSQGEAQHMGVGSRLVQKAKEMAKEAGYTDIAVISAIGTREYYAKHHGFEIDDLYMTASLENI